MDTSILFFRVNSCLEANLSRYVITEEFWDTHGLSPGFKIGAIITGIVMLLLLLVGLPSNVIIIVSILKQRLYKLPTHILLMNLATSDFLICLLVMPFTIIASFAGGFIYGDSDYIRCRFCQSGLIYVALSIFSSYNLSLLSLDRFIFIKFPFRYHKVVTVRRVIAAVAVVWIISILQSLLPLAKFGEISYIFSISTCVLRFNGKTSLTKNIYYVIFLVVLGLVPLAVVIVTNSWIICIVRKHIKKIYGLRKTFSDERDLKQQREYMKKQINKEENKKQLALVRTFGVIMAANILVWIPLVAYTIVGRVNTIPNGLIVFVYIMFTLHSVQNPLIEGCFIPEIKASFRKIFRFLFCRDYFSKKNLTTTTSTPTCSVPEGAIRDETCCSQCVHICSFSILPESSEEN